jgi:ATP-binding cassette, subfamily B, bacterial PglK
MRSIFEYLRQILFLFGPDKKRIPRLVALFLGSSLIELLGIALILPLVTTLTDPEALNEGPLGGIAAMMGSRLAFLLLLSACLVVAFIAKAVVLTLIMRSVFWFSGRQLSRLMSTLVYRYQTRPYERHIQQNSADMLGIVNRATETFYQSVAAPLLRLVAESIVVVAILIILAWLDWRIVVSLAVLFGGAGLLYERIVRKMMQRDSERVQGAYARVIRDVQEGVSGLKETRILGRHLDFYRRARDSAEGYATSQIRFGVLSGLPRNVFETLIVTFFVGLCIALQMSGSNFAEQLPVLSAFAVAGLRLIPSSSRITSSIVSLRYGRHATQLLYSELSALKESEVAPLESAVEPSNATQGNEESFRALDLKRVNYAYPESGSFALSGVDFTLKAGDSIGIIGPSGAGKTTLVDVLLGLLDPQEGTILFNGRDLATKGVLEEWHSNVAYLPQDVFLVDGTLTENITLRETPGPEASAQLASAIAKAQLTGLIEQLPDGLETQIGERGVRLSGGQRQRLALARAFYHGRSVLVLDEATSALDGDTESEIVNEIKRLKGKITLVVIAHRLSTVEHCDRIYRLEAGRIARAGTFADVVGAPKPNANHVAI